MTGQRRESGSELIQNPLLVKQGHSGPSDSHHKALIVCFTLAFLWPVYLFVLASFLDLVFKKRPKTPRNGRCYAATVAAQPVVAAQ